MLSTEETQTEKDVNIDSWNAEQNLSYLKNTRSRKRSVRTRIPVQHGVDGRLVC